MRDRGCLLGLALCCASAALVVGALMFAPAAVLAGHESDLNIADLFRFPPIKVPGSYFFAL